MTRPATAVAYAGPGTRPIVRPATPIAAISHRARDLVLMDERRGRAAARRLGLSVQGTLGVLVRAKRAGALETVGAHLHSLRRAGFWIADDIVGRTLDAAGEAMLPE